jgi:hypothetical protein
MGKIAATLGAILVLALIAGGLTEVTLAVGHRQTTVDLALAPKASSSPSPSASPRKTATPTPTPSVTASPSPSPSPSVQAGPTATTNSFVHLRQGPSTSTAILENLNGGTEVTLLSYSDSTWQEVSVDGYTGYIYRSYLTY